MTSHSNLSAASAEFGKIAVEQSNEAAAAMAIFLAISASEAYAAELEQRQAIAAAVADSVATAQPVTVTVTNVENAIRFLRSRFVDVDHDAYPDRVVIFGDDQRVHVSESGDGDEGHWVLNLVIPSTALVAIFRKPSGETVTDSLSYHEPMSEALDAAREDAHRYGWTFVSLQTVNA
jgi:hypothetical protein